MRNKNNPPRKKILSIGPRKLIRFENEDQIELIKKAAARRGLSFVAFVRMACIHVAGRVIALPPETILGSDLAAVETGETAA